MGGTRKIEGGKVELNCHLDIGMHLDIAKYSNIAGRIFESVELSMRGGSWRESERRCMEVLGGSPFLVTRPGSAAQAGAVERLLKLHKE